MGKVSIMKPAKVAVTKNGPYLVSGGLPLAKETIICDKEGNPLRWERGKSYPDKESYALCRCGKSKNKPYCDGTHEKGFDGTETASRKTYAEIAKKIKGPELNLTDAKELCSSARFCHRAGGIWKLTRNSGNKEAKETAIQEAFNCPSGRLVEWEKTGKPLEPKLTPSISIEEGPQKNASGPIWLKGNAPLESADGTKYETRNRVTLCRCGSSNNKPFCDGSHITIGFNDND